MTIKELGPNFDKDWRNDLNNNFRELSGIQGSVNDAVNKAKTAEQIANDAKTTANSANNTSNSVQEQLNQIVIEGDSSVEAAQARMDEKGIVHPNLKDRIDEVGVRSNTAINQIEILSNKGKLIIPRHSSIYQDLKLKRKMKGAVIGDSNGAGVGSSSYAQNWIWKLTKQIQSYTGVGTTTDYAIKTYAVGSQNIRQSIPFLAYTMNGKRTDMLKMKSKHPFLIIMTGLNDSKANFVPLDEFEWLYRLTVRTAIERGIDVICCTETCGVDMKTGKLKDTEESLYAPYMETIIQISEQEGASFVDINLKFKQMYAQGIDVRQYSADGTHLNDNGHTIVSDLVFQCITTPSIGGARKINPNESIQYKFIPNVLLDYDTSSNASYVTDITLSNGGLRELNDKPNLLKISNGGFAEFKLPSFPWYAVLITVVMKASTGTLSVQSRSGFALPGATNITIPNHLNVNAETTLIFYAGVQEAEIRNTIKLLANNGDVIISGITLLTHTLIVEHTPKPVPTSQTGSWVNTSFNPTYQGIYSSKTIGSKVIFKWYGTSVEFGMIYAPNAGQTKITTDGETITKDLYSTGVSEIFVSNQKSFSLGWHTTEIEVIDKNSSASDNLVGISNVKVYSCKNSDNTIVARANTGINVYVDIVNPTSISGVVDFTLTNNVINVSNDSVLEVKQK
ncbi:SGNH/GDSL hydrolase family protein [Bacillus wiedmannii]|uniref:SGNH/GDSL hydrolase family protein n=1 Tax=Bacillus wiedmannii TaxID=1890302 RepID=UPI00086AA77E|nr:SGNH/GDSL hydrolase family protein [Bacillus wiedmannii]SCN11916.1 Uncharacterized protein BCRIVMBC126_05791 [Bacillus wiedmannii]